MDQNIRLRKPEPAARELEPENALRRQVAAWLDAPISDGYAHFTDDAHAVRFDRIMKAHSE